MQFSIIVPVYKTEKYLKECVESILQQSFHDYELILVDDGSPDSCPQICDEYALTHNNIRVIHQQNKGLMLARRAGIAVAQGEYVMHIDSDDYLLHNALQCLHDALAEYPCDLLFFDYIVGASSKGPEKRIKVRNETRVTTFSTPEHKVLLCRQLLVGGFLGSLCIKVTKKSIIDLDADYTQWKCVANGEDYFQSFPLFEKANSFVYLPFPMYYYRRDNESMSKRYGENDFESFKQLFVRKVEYAGKWKLLADTEDKIRLNYFDMNMVILRDVRAYHRNQLPMYLRKICNDETFVSTAKKLKLDKMSRYYRIMRLMILYKAYPCISMLMTAAEWRRK